MRPSTATSNAPLKSFEVQTYRNGKWSVDSVFDDHQLATFEARRMDESGRFGGVRVIEETWDPTTNRTMTRTVYRDSKVQKTNQEILDRSRAQRQQKTESKQRKIDRTQGYGVTRARKARDRIRRNASPVRLTLMLILIVGFALAARLLLDKVDHLVK